MVRVTRVQESIVRTRIWHETLDKEIATAVSFSFICGRQGIQSFSNILHQVREKERTKIIGFATILSTRHREHYFLAHMSLRCRLRHVIMRGARARLVSYDFRCESATASRWLTCHFPSYYHAYAVKRKF